MLQRNTEQDALLGGNIKNDEQQSAKPWLKWLMRGLVAALIGAVIYILVSQTIKTTPDTSSSNDAEIQPNSQVYDDSKSSSNGNIRPNIVFIVADDLGYADIGYNGAEYETPAIDSLYTNGIPLTNHYAMFLCSASRSTLLSGLVSMCSHSSCENVFFFCVLFVFWYFFFCFSVFFCFFFACFCCFVLLFCCCVFFLGRAGSGNGQREGLVLPPVLW